MKITESGAYSGKTRETTVTGIVENHSDYRDQGAAEYAKELAANTLKLLDKTLNLLHDKGLISSEEVKTLLSDYSDEGTKIE